MRETTADGQPTDEREAADQDATVQKTSLLALSRRSRRAGEQNAHLESDVETAEFAGPASESRAADRSEGAEMSDGAKKRRGFQAVASAAALHRRRAGRARRNRAVLLRTAGSREHADPVRHRGTPGDGHPDRDRGARALCDPQARRITCSTGSSRSSSPSTRSSGSTSAGTFWGCCCRPSGRSSSSPGWDRADRSPAGGETPEPPRKKGRLHECAQPPNGRHTGGSCPRRPHHHRGRNDDRRPLVSAVLTRGHVR